MGATPTYGLRYPELVDPADVPTDMNELAIDVEAALALMQALSAKGVANGYASLDASGKVPASQLPAAAVPSYGTTLPASPVDGQEAILVNSITAPTYTWRFRYNAASASPYRWEFGGGYAWQDNDDNDAVTTSAGWNPLGALASFVLPRSGDYTLTVGMNVYASVIGYAYSVIGLNATPAGNLITHGIPIADNWTAQQMRTVKALGVAAGTQVQLWHAAGANGVNTHFGNRVLSVLPRRVS